MEVWREDGKLKDASLRTNGGSLKTTGWSLRTDGGSLRMDGGSIRIDKCLTPLKPWLSLVNYQPS